jgi:outer membrane autotransporter barrel domain
MNRIYRLVWNRALGVMQVASEVARSPRGGAVACADDRAPAMTLRPLAAVALALFAGVLLSSVPMVAHATPLPPQGGTPTQPTDDGSVISGTQGTAGITGPVNGAGGLGEAGGAALDDAGATTSNGGHVYGGAGGFGGPGGVGADGVYTGESSNGSPGTGGGAGGSGNVGGAGVVSPGVFTNAGVIQAGAGGRGGAGGTGGRGGRGYDGAGGNGGAGGAGGAGSDGGIGVVGSGFTLTNTGVVSGGRGGNGGAGGNGGVGGYSKYSAGGAGGNGGTGGAGGRGGAGVSGAGFVLVNTGTIVGGDAGAAGAGGSGASAGSYWYGSSGSTGTAGAVGQGGLGGVGVISTGNATITNSGLISGGLNSDGTYADAVELSGGNNNLILEAGYQFRGNVESQGGDTLTFGGATDASFDISTVDAYSPTDTTFNGFSQFAKSGISTWTLTGTNSSMVGLFGIAAGSLVLSGTDNEFDGTFTMQSGSALTVEASNVIAADTGASGFPGVPGGPAPIDALAGLAGVSGAGFTLTNAGRVYGGNGGAGGSGYMGSTGMPGAGGAGGAAVSGSGFTAINSGDLYGGAGGIGGKYQSLTTPTGIGGAGGAGGAAVAGTGFMLTNSGRIVGGSGATGGLARTNTGKYSTTVTGMGGTGGAGVSGSGFTLVNQAGGSIRGGDAGTSPAGATTAGGAGVVATGGATIDNAGTISGGANADGTQANAVSFSGGGNNLILRDTAGFSGYIVSTSGSTAGGDTLTFALTHDISFDAAFAGAVGSNAPVQGFSHFTKAGSNTLTLTGTGSADQAWTISSGSLVGTTDSVVGNVTFAPSAGNSANLTFDQATDGTYNGVLSGNGSLTKDGDGTLTLTGNNTYTGITTINGGSLLVSHDGVTGMFAGDVMNNAALVFNRADTVSYDAVISGTGTVTQAGTGLLMLNGVNTYTGRTTVKAGTLEVGDADHASASLQSAVQVDADGTLRGHGTINGDVTSDGIVWPGGSVGQLTINGNYTQNAGATLQVDVTPTEASQLLVHGTATLGGTLSLVYAPGTYTTSNYTLLRADSVSGQFATTTSSGSVPTAASPTVSYTGTQVNLSLTAPATTTPDNPTAPAVVAPLDSGIYANFMRAANLSGQQSMNTVLGATLRPAETSCGEHAATAGHGVTASCNNGLWAQYSGGSNELTGSNGLRSTTFGLQAGGDVAVGDSVHVGLEGGVDRINGNDRSGGNGHIDSAHGGVYAFANAGPLVVSGLIDQALGSYRLNRQTGTGQAYSSPDGRTTAAALQVAWPLAAAAWQFTPAVGALYQHQRLDGFHETVNSASPLAASFALEGTRSTYTTMQPYVTLAFVRPFTAGGIRYVPQFDVGYRYDTRNGHGPVVSTQSQDGTLFALPGEGTGRGMTTAGARITAEAGTSWSLYLDYQGQFSSHLNANALSVGFTKHF